MATVKKTAGTTAKKKKPAMGSAAVARPEAKPFPGTAKKGKKALKAGVMQVDPLFLYDIRVWDGTAWLKLGEIWFDTEGIGGDEEPSKAELLIEEQRENRGSRTKNEREQPFV